MLLKNNFLRYRFLALLLLITLSSISNTSKHLPYSRLQSKRPSALMVMSLPPGYTGASECQSATLDHHRVSKSFGQSLLPYLSLQEFNKLHAHSINKPLTHQWHNGVLKESLCDITD